MNHLATIVLVLSIIVGCNQLKKINPPAKVPNEIPWKWEELSKVPSFEWVKSTDSLKALIYEGEAYHNKSTDVFAYYSSPAVIDSSKVSQRFPAVVLVHGGGGTAFPFWVKLWAKRGYAAIAMDLDGKIPDDAGVPISLRKQFYGGPPHDDQHRLYNIDSVMHSQWQFHAISNIIRAHSLMLNLAEVDRDRTALTGISWGGYLSCIVAGLDQRFKAIVPVYGCGYIHEKSYWTDQKLFEPLTSMQKEKWINYWDPANYVGATNVPILFINGDNDPYYYLEIWKKTVSLIDHAHSLIIEDLPHGHQAGAKLIEIKAFFDNQL